MGYDTKGWVGHALVALVLCYSFALSLRPLADPDLWWHLATAEFMWEHGTLPAPGGEDPFTYSTPRPLPEANIHGLRSQWLGQLLLYIPYKIGGYALLAVMRSALIVLPFALLLAVYAGRAPALSLMPGVFAALLLSLNMYYAYERPQAFSFLMAPALYLALRRLYDTGRASWPALLLPALLMALWGNLHGAYNVGVAMMGLFSAGVLGEGLLRGRAIWGVSTEGAPDRAGMTRVLAACGLGVAASGLNPSGYEMLGGWARKIMGAAATGGLDQGLRQSSLTLASVAEYKPLWFFHAQLHQTWPLIVIGFYIAILGALGARYVLGRRVDLPEALTALGLTALGLYYVRGMFFALLVLAPMGVRAMGRMGPGGRRAGGLVMAALCLWLVADTYMRTPWRLDPRPEGHWVESSYPEGAIAFMEGRAIEGPMLNELGWGGYLIWRAYPAYRVFIDGRLVNSGTTAEYMDMLMARPGGMEAIERHGINFMLMQVVNEQTGAITPLVLHALGEGRAAWRPVFTGDNAVILVRTDRESNRALLDCCEVRRSEVFGEALAVTDSILDMNPGHTEARITQALAFHELGAGKRAASILRSIPDGHPLKGALMRRLGNTP